LVDTGIAAEVVTDFPRWTVQWHFIATIEQGYLSLPNISMPE